MSFWFRSSKRTHEDAMQLLAKTRAGAAVETLQKVETNAVTAWYDPGHVETQGTTHAFRAVTETGALGWLVMRAEQVPGIFSPAKTWGEAIVDTETGASALQAAWLGFTEPRKNRRPVEGYEAIC